MGEEKTYPVVLPEDDQNTDVGTVDGISLLKGDTEPKRLTKDQIERLRDAGMKLDVLEKDDDPLDKIRTHEQADAALKAAGVTSAEGTSVEDKVQALRDKQENQE